MRLSFFYILSIIVIYLTSLCVNCAVFGMSGPDYNASETRPTSAKKAQITQERVEYNVFLFDEPLKGSKSLKIFKIKLTFRFDKLSHLSKSVHIGENSQILTVSNKKNCSYGYKNVFISNSWPVTNKVILAPKRIKN
jgi:hypothetical protein